jgi:hypothetical protein
LPRARAFRHRGLRKDAVVGRNRFIAPLGEADCATPFGEILHALVRRSVVALWLGDERRLLALGALEDARLKDGHHEDHRALAAIASGCRWLGCALLGRIPAQDALRVPEVGRGDVARPQAALTPAVPALAENGAPAAVALPRLLADLGFT